MSDRLKGRAAIVTGGRRGIGLAIMECLAESGASVLFTDIDEDDGRQTEARLKGLGHNVRFLKADAASPQDAKLMAEAAMEAFGRIDILCPNAAIFPETSIADISSQEWDQVTGINLKGPFLAAQACLPHMQARRWGRIVLTSSITGPIVMAPGHAHYAASKAGMLGFMRAAALEWAPWNITVNAVQPGNILSEGMKLNRSQAYIDDQRAAIPLGRLGDPRDVGMAVRFLASDEAAYITGQAIAIDGGQTLPEMQSAILPRMS